jgi:pyridoxal phosphate enzyme (YggS family)
MAGPAAGVSDRAREIARRVELAARRAGRPPSAVTLVAASKSQPPAALAEAFAAGIRVFGENRVQEAEPKIAALPGPRWHFIGRLQRNKARRAVELFELIHSVDSVRLAEALARLGEERGRPVCVLVEVNLGGEATKGGFEVDELPEALAALAGRPGLEVQGLMTIPPPVDDPEQSRPFFRRLAELARRHDLPQLSMGMSDDFEVAIEEGATFVRVGTALFGERLP